MLKELSAGRVFGLLVCCVVLTSVGERLLAADTPAASKPAEVATEHKAEGSAQFLLADYEQELIECSALAAIHMWIGDNIGEDSGSELRKTLAKDYWTEVSKEYLSLAREAGGEDDLYQEVGVRMRILAAEWRRLTETEFSADNWDGWYERVDRCDAWRPEQPTRAYYSKGRELIAARNR